MTTQRPAISVIVPTYNRADPLRRTLESLAVQRLSRGELEVVVADDGSSDRTREVVRAFEPRLPLRYHFQPDRGFRAGAARNAGARLASGGLLAFLDAGVLAGPDFARAHLDAHAAGGGAPVAVLGLTYGYDTDNPWFELAALLDGVDAEAAVARFGAEPRFRDMRHPILAGAGFDLPSLTGSWFFCWTVNLSVSTAVFHAVGGFDEDFRGWGGEDQDLGYRLLRRGVRLVASRRAWGIEIPHPRATGANLASSRDNALLFLHKHPDPEVEVFAALFLQEPRSAAGEPTGPGDGPVAPTLAWAYREFTEGCRLLAGWSDTARGLDVAAELRTAVDQALALAGPEARILVLGSGAVPPPGLPANSTLLDFDARLLERALSAGRHRGRHGVGIAIAEFDDAYDAVVISSRLAGLWARWHALILSEAHRVAPVVVAPFLCPGPITRASAPVARATPAG